MMRGWRHYARTDRDRGELRRGFWRHYARTDRDRGELRRGFSARFTSIVYANGVTVALPDELALKDKCVAVCLSCGL
ncbi:hypothetical protein NDU88_006972 [Pleurodeles waltl]|uniref:Uncharacterized protein n=1 Tax=Pleurodeles waltl TaxID=8319 RepID=A0AAV7MFJ8_PLEWA|nr:hypothetical protein NDU88_006972 [Pleurodeles waltl]